MRVHLRTPLAAAALAAAAAGCREASRGAPAATAPVASAAVGAAPAESAPEADLRIAYDAARDRLDLVARDVPLARVLAALAAETGVAIEDESGRDRTGRVSPQLEGVPLADATSELLRGEAKAFGFSPPGPGAPARLVRILLLPPRGDRVAAVVAAVHDGGDERAAGEIAAQLAAPGQAEERALAIDALADALAEEPQERRARAVRALVAIDRRAAARELARRLRDPQGRLARDPAARARVVWALGFVGDAASEPVLVEAFLGEDRGVRDAAAASLGRLRDAARGRRAGSGTRDPG